MHESAARKHLETKTRAHLSEGLIDASGNEAILRELPNDTDSLKRICLALIGSQLSISKSCKDSIKRLMNLNMILATRIDPTHILGDSHVTKNYEEHEKRLRDLQNPRYTSIKDTSSIKETSTKDNPHTKSDSNEGTETNPTVCNLPDKSDYPENDVTSEPRSAVQESFEPNKSREDASLASARKQKKEHHHVKRDPHSKPSGSKKDEVLKKDEMLKKGKSSTSGKSKHRDSPEKAYQSHIPFLYKQSEADYVFNDPPNFEYKQYLEDKLILVSYIFAVPHANPVPSEVFKFYCTAKDTYLHKNQLECIRDGSLYLKKTSYREEDDDDGAAEKKKLVRFGVYPDSQDFYIKAATREKIVQRLLRPMIDSYYDYIILVMHPVFMESSMLLKYTFNRVKSILDLGPLSEDRKAFNKTCRLRVARFWSKWIEHFWDHFEQDKSLLEDLLSFIKNFIKSQDDQIKHNLHALIEKKQAEAKSLQEDETPKAKDGSNNKSKPDKIPRGAVKSMGILNFPISLGKRTKSHIEPIKESPAEDSFEGIVENFAAASAEEIAKQLTLIEDNLLASIKSTELLNLNWTKSNKSDKSLNVLKLTKWSNHVVHLFTTSIVSTRDNAKARVAAMEKAILVADHLRKLGNYNGLIEIMSALMSASVYRLKKTRHTLDPIIRSTFESLMMLVSGKLNYKNLRSEMRKKKGPIIPFPGLIQSDLVFIDAFNKLYLDKDKKLISMRYLELYSASIFSMIYCRSVSYSIEPNPQLLHILKNYPTVTDEVSYELSLECESRTKDRS